MRSWNGGKSGQRRHAAFESSFLSFHPLDSVLERIFLLLEEFKMITQNYVMEAIQQATEQYKLDTAELIEKIQQAPEKEQSQQALLYALNRIAMDQPNWTFVAA